MRTEHAVPLACFTTLGVGGPAGRLVTAETEAELVAQALAHPTAFLLAGGSNVVIPDEGLPGTVLKVATRGVQEVAGGWEVAAGEDWDALVARTVRAGRSGLEALSGIPGSVGATPVQNVGAYGRDVSQTVVRVRALDRRSGQVVELEPAACRFSYRGSIFKAEPARWVVLAVVFAVPADPLSAPLRYAELAAAVGVEPGGRAPLAVVRDAVLALRRSKGMVVDGEDPDTRSVGSFFTNPVLAATEVARLRATFGPLTSWPEPGGGSKVSAAALIERAGFVKGWGQGRAGLSTKHVLALVNRGGATAAEVLAVARTIRDTVAAVTGVVLVAEPILAGGLEL